MVKSRYFYIRLLLEEKINASPLHRHATTVLTKCICKVYMLLPLLSSLAHIHKTKKAKTEYLQQINFK
jgi:hypothetical protein